MAGPNMMPWLRKEAESAPDAFRTKAFLKLQKQWYGKLAADGFVDAEFESMSVVTPRSPVADARGASRAEYYRVAGWWLHDRVFPSRFAKRAFELHAEGVSFRDMLALLRPMEHASLRTVWRSVVAEVELLRAHYQVAA